MNLSIASLSQAGVISLRVIANLALILQVKDTSDTRWAFLLRYDEESHILALDNIHLLDRNGTIYGQTGTRP